MRTQTISPAAASLVVATLALAACFPLPGPVPPSGPSCLSFGAPLAVGTRYGPPTHAAGAVVLISGPLSMAIEPLLHPSGARSMNFAAVDAARPGAAAGASLAINNVAMRIATSSRARRASFEFTDLGGHENFTVNGGPVAVGDLSTMSGTVQGVKVQVTASPIPGGRQGRVDLEGPIDSLTVGGQEFWIDNVCFEP